MDAILEQKVESLRRCIKRVSEKTPDDVSYEAINWEIVFAICTRSLDDFRQFAQEIAALDS